MSHNLDEIFPEHLYSRYLTILAGRLAKTLEVIGQEMHPKLSRERVRQLEVKAHKALTVELDKRFPGLKLELQALMQGGVACDEAEISTVFEATFPGACEIVLRHFGCSPCVVFEEPVSGWWSEQPTAIEALMRSMAEEAPFADDEMAQRAEAAGLPAALDAHSLLSRAGSPLKLHPGGRWWVRRTAVNRDAAYLVLLERGEPLDGDLLAVELGVNDHNLKEAMRRDERFVQLRPAGTWALVEWNLPGTEHRSTLEVILQLLADQGPMDYEDLARKTLAIYPVTTWRVSQCMASDQIGRMDDGRVGLIRDGAHLVEEEAPPVPANVALSDDGQLIAVKLTADFDMMRGSGLPFPRFVGWALGLKHVPSSKSFRLENPEQEITITKQLGMLQISSLRKAAMDAGASEGCTIAVLLRLDAGIARVVHGCDPGTCAVG